MSNAGSGNESAWTTPIGGRPDASVSQLPWDPAPSADSLVRYDPGVPTNDDYGTNETTNEHGPTDEEDPSERADSVSSSGSVTLRVRVGNRLAYAGDRTRQSVMTQIIVGGGAVASPAMGTHRMPVNVALVIDRSGSMEGEPLEQVKKACCQVVDLLGPDDVLSIITFEESIEVLMPARRVTDRALVKEHVGRIVPGNTTNLFDGLYAAGSQVGSVPNMGTYVSRILLLTDGEPTAGLRDFASIVNQVADLKRRGITVTALGFGPDYNEELMAGIARRSGGNYYYIARADEIPAVFAREMQQVLGVTARNPRMSFYLPRGCTVRQVYGAQPTFNGRTVEVTLADIEQDATVSRLWEMEWEPRPSGLYRVARIVLLWEDAVTGRTETAAVNAVVEFVEDGDPTHLAPGVDPIVSQELAVATVSRDLERTMQSMRTQQMNVSDITQSLERTQQLLRTQGRGDAADDLATAAASLRRGGGSSEVEKTLIGTIYNLEQGKRR